MTASEQHHLIISKLNSQVNKVPTFEQLKLYFSEATYILEDCPKEKKFAFSVSNFAKKWCEKLYMSTQDKKFWYLYWDLMKFEAPHLLDSYCIYIERNRPAKERFYLPRRKTLIKVVRELQALEDDELDEIFIHMPARVGKSQIITMASVWHCCRDMESSNLYATYKESLGGAFIDGVKEIITDPTYVNSEIFPKAKIAATDAKANKLWLGRKKKYASLSGKGLESGLNGEYDANGWLIIDDIIEGIQDVMNPDTLKRKQDVFDNNLMSRAKEKCKIIYNGTIWSLHDIYMDRQSFLESNPKASDVRWNILKIPALDPETDESNFDYQFGVGFSTKYYQMKRAKFEENDDMSSWFAQYQQEPIEREGAVFDPHIMRFYEELPAEEPTRICAACDVALGGGDYLSMPLAYVYEDGSVYIEDVVFDKRGKEVTQKKVVEMLIKHDCGSAFFESNQGGIGYKDEVVQMLKEKDFRLRVETAYAPNNMRKFDRIWDKRPEIIEFYFKADKCRSAEYRKFMQNVFNYTETGTNKHDDAPDSLASLASFIRNRKRIKRARVMQSPI